MVAEMLIGNRGLIEDLTGFEIVGRAARIVLIDGINSEISRQQERWKQADLEFEAAGYDVGIRAKGLENISSNNIFQGPHKSLSQSTLDRFPNISVIAYASRPGTGNTQFDQMDLVEISVIVEMIVKAGPVVEGQELFYESVAHRRIERTTEAVLTVIRRSRNLLGTVNTVTQPRGGIVNSTWIRDTQDGQGDLYVLHASRFQYALNRQSSIPI
jgi:hypothetical protein